MNIDSMIRSGTGRWYDYVGQGVQFGLNMLVFALGVSGAWSGISNLVGELNYKKMQKLAQEVSCSDIDGGEKLTRLLERERKTYTVDPSMQAKDIEMGVLVDGAYIKNPTAKNMSDLIKPGSNYVGNSKMNGQFMYVVDTDGNIIIGSRAGRHMPIVGLRW